MREDLTMNTDVTQSESGPRCPGCKHLYASHRPRGCSGDAGGLVHTTVCTCCSPRYWALVDAAGGTNPPSLPASPPADSISSRRIVANRAELFAAALYRLASDMEAAAQRPSDTKMQSILEADRTEAVGAGERLSMVLEVGAPPVLPQVLHLTRSPLKVPALALRQWADRWDAYAMSIDP